MSAVPHAQIVWIVTLFFASSYLSRWVSLAMAQPRGGRVTPITSKRRGDVTLDVAKP